MSTWRYASVHASAGYLPAGTIREWLPLTVTSAVRALGPGPAGSMSGTIPSYDPKATEDNLEPIVHEIVAFRQEAVGAPWKPVWDGLCTSAVDDGEQVQVQATEVHGPLFGRAHESDESYSTTVDAIVEDLLTAELAKTGGAMYRFTRAYTGTWGSKTWAFSGAGRRIAGLTIDDLLAGEGTYRLGLSGDRETWDRELQFGAPRVGVDVTGYVLSDRRGVRIAVSKDGQRGATRVHVRGGNGLVSSASNSTLLTAGYALVEQTVDRPEITSQAALDAIAAEQLELLAPPYKTYTVEWEPTDEDGALPFDLCDLGDTVHIVKTGGYSAVDADVRVVQIEMIPPSPGNRELVRLTVDDVGV